MKRDNFILEYTRRMPKKYAGRFVAVVNEKVIAIGDNRLEVFHRAEKLAPTNVKIGVFYFPTRKEMLTAL